MRPDGELPDAELLCRARGEPEAFGAFYRRHLASVLAFMHTRTGSREVAADLTAEVFASALQAVRSFDPDRGSADAWLYAIAKNTFRDSVRRGRVADRARRKLGFGRLELTEDDLSRVDELLDQAHGHTPASDALADLTPQTRRAVAARVLEDCDYDAIATELQCSPLVARKRVSRGLAALRARLDDR